jgi:hypothetical protein
MHSAPSIAPLLGLAGLIIFLVSRQKLKTLGRMVAAFFITTLVICLIGAFLRTGDPEMFGALAAQIGLGVGDAFGLFHVLRIQRERKLKAKTQSQPQP